MEYRGINFVRGNDSIGDDKMQAIVASQKMRDWCNQQVDGGVVNTTTVKINDVKFFGPVAPEKLGFVMIEGTATEVATGDKLMATCAFIRGGSVAVFVHVHIKDSRLGDYAVFTEQIRYPMGTKLQESCAGCVDAKTGDVVGVAITELKEELGVVISKEDLVSLGSIIPSGGGTYESIELFYLSVSMTEDEVQKKIEETFGVEDEKIRLVFTSLKNMDEYLDEIGDVKAECAWRRIKSRGLI